MSDPLIPRFRGGLRMCFWCQRKAIMAGGLLLMLSDDLEHKLKGIKRLIYRQTTWITGDDKESGSS